MPTQDEVEAAVKRIWEHAIPTESSDWVERVSALPATADPLGDYGPIVRSILDTGTPASVVARLARIVAYQAVFGALYELDGEACPGGHEVILGLDPSGREMRPPT